MLAEEVRYAAESPEAMPEGIVARKGGGLYGGTGLMRRGK
jgi:hypothetical protein